MIRDQKINANTRTILERWKRDNDALRRKTLMLNNAMTRRRSHIYRQWASEIVSRYDVIRVEDLDLSKMYRLPAANEAKAAGGYELWSARENRRVASVGLLLSIINNAARLRGKRVEKIEAVWTTRTCARCGGYFDVERGNLEGGCHNCGRVVDQDWNAAENIFASLPPREAMNRVPTAP